MKKFKIIICLYILQILFLSPTSFALWEDWLDQTTQNISFAWNFLSLSFFLNLIFAVLVFFITLWLSKKVNNKLSTYLEIKVNDNSNKKEIIWVLNRTVTITIYIIGFSIILWILWIDTWIFMWWIWFGIWFALKTFLTNFVAWIMMLTQWIYHNWDIIEILWKQWRIRKINALFTSIEQFDWIMFFVPNIKFLEENVSNYYSNEKRRIEIEVWIDYEEDVVKSKKVLLNILSKLPDVLQEPKPRILVDKFWDSEIVLTLMFWINSVNWHYLQTKSNVIETINLAFKTNWIEMCFPQMTISYRDENYFKNRNKTL